MESDRKVLSEYVLRRRVQFYETDAAGIVHFSWFFRYMEEAEHALWRAAGLSIHPPDSPIGWARAAATFDFRRALRFEDEFDVTIRIAAISRRTIRYACVLTKDDVTLAEGTMTVICVRRESDGSLKAANVPEEIAARFAVSADAAATEADPAASDAAANEAAAPDPDAGARV